MDETDTSAAGEAPRNERTAHPTANPTAKKGRGALSNPANRFVSTRVEPASDGWWQDDAPRSIVTEVIEEKVRTIISTNQSPDIPFEQSINPYRGCEHGCIYCYARPSHAYWDMSPGLDFETRIIAKPGAAALLRKTLDHPKYVCKSINIGANTDPYQPLEAKRRTTREVLEVLRAFNHPFSIITKSALILRDIDILSEMAAKNLCSVAVSVTTLDNDLKRKLEPRTASPAARLRTISALSDAGVRVALMAAPIIPAINDSELEDILEAGKAAGARTANYIFLRLPLEIAPMFREWLSEHYPDRANHVMSLVQQSRGGKDYKPGFHTRMSAEGVFAELLRKRFRVAAKRLGLFSDDRFELDTTQFRRSQHQMDLF
ncbi:MAG: PA0069 family radical SAM protein [Pseudomonadales bacterium]|nr:PA0069 family radical SAM protein [Pseudomonadales bacterium]